ncbi:MAG: ABC transporter permease [Spirochaetes bacterium]|nr:ABC transporter permease [Spirochaetota bacterium]
MRNPILNRRIAAFRANRRANVSLYLFAVLFIISVLAEFVANDKPILVWYDGKPYVPIIRTYLESEFGGDLEIEASYRDPYVAELIMKKGWMIWPPVPYRYDTIDYELDVPAPAPPSFSHWLGTDDGGHDVVALIIYGFRISVMFGIVLTVFSTIIGVAAGAVQGYFGGLVDLLFQRFIEMWSSLPSLYLIIIITSVIQPTFGLLLVVLLLFRWLSLVGVVRAEFLRVRNFEFVKAARALGVSNTTIIFRHILPNAMVSTFTFLPFILNGSIIALTSLDFLGLGLPPGSPSLGKLLAQGKANLQAPWLGITSFVVLSLMLSLLIFIGEGIRDAFDPRREAG